MNIHKVKSIPQWTQLPSPAIFSNGQLSMKLGIDSPQIELINQVEYLQVQLELAKTEYNKNIQQVQKFQTLLQYINEQVRDNLDEQKTLTIITQELFELLELHRCQIEIYNPYLTCATVTYEYSSSLPHCQGLIRAIADFPQVYQDLLAKQIWKSVEIVPGYQPSLQIMSQLACPIFDHQVIWGNIWLIRETETKFTELEISFLQQVANECAIALRQSQLNTKTKRQAKKIQKKERQKQEFIKHIAHELRKPITNISLAVQTLASLMKPPGILDQEIVFELLQILNDECSRENKLLNDLLTFIYLQTNAEPPTLITIDFSHWLSTVVESFRDVTTCQQQHLHLDIPLAIQPISTDISDLEKIITLLLNEACQCTPPKQSITITTCLHLQTIELKINISGVEIPHHQISQIFQPFYNLPKYSSWQAQNTGLELALVKTMVQRLQGLIHVVSINSNITFVIQFPLQPVF